ncbi:alpha-2-macroglobulin family protein, partial [Terriglobus sp. YAF25]|uniref:alpha-2-macroglobulin family protein n=1 Tax=Terriglobus sp. YAF25 TaxID=3233080 RepID=UPI003F952F9D
GVEMKLHVDADDHHGNRSTNTINLNTRYGGGVEMKLHVDADDHHGNRSTNTINLNTRYGEDQVLLRVAHGVYKPGDLIRATVFSTRQSGTAYIDIVKDGQTIQTRDVDIVHGRAELSLRATPQMAGTLSMHTYIFGGDAQTVADHRMIFVQPADELHIQATADAASYLPGSEARVRFHVTNEKGEGVQAALGLEIVDEAVFALAEKQPGFAKVFFYLEEELLKPRFEIHSLSMNDAVVPADASQQDAHDRAARVLFSAAEDVREHAVRTEAIQALPLAQTFAFHDRYQAAYTEHVQLLLQQLPQEDGHIQDLPKRFALVKEDEGSKPHDAWGVSLRVEPVWQTTRRQNSLLRFYNIRSAGPDHRFGTQDDLITMVSGSGDTFSEQRPGAMEWRLEHDRGPLNGRSEITGVITDASGAVIPNASLQLHRIDAAGTWRGTSTKDGSFRFAALTSGRYRLKISASGFASAADEVTLRPQDRAIVTCTLAVGFVTQSVEVATAAAPVVMTQSAEMVQVVNGREFGNLARMAPRAGAALAHADSSAKAPASEGNADHVRSYFPEALYINPEIITDGHGNASIGIPIADSITTWRMAMFASTKAGTLGSGVSSLKVFQDFFVDLDLPVTLTQGDCVSIPVAVYNYTSGRGEVTLSLQQEDWFDLVDDNAEKHVSIDAGKVGGEQFTLRVKRLGKFKLTLAAHLQGESDRKDTVVREIEVVPNGQQQEVVFNGRLESTAQHSVRFPQNALPDASKLFVRLYPGPLSQVIEGMDGILQMPGGCFEQTSSSTYPNVLALDYMKHTKKLTPEVHAKAEGYIANGYQRLLTFEVPGGGFSWFGNTPANKILTAYGLMEFRDMSHVYDVDPRVLERTGAWLAAQQQRDGSWKPDTQFINEGATNRYNSDALRITAYLAWALEGDSEQHAAVEKAKGYIVSNLDSVTSNKTDAYTLAVLANFAVSEDKHSELTRRVLQRLADARTEKGEQAWWSSAETGLYATGDSAAVETTGLAVQALLHSGQYPEIARRALAWILSKKNSYGNWGSTQATIMALRALLLASEGSAGDASGKVQVLLNGEAVQTLNLDAGNNDLLHQFVLPQPGTGAENAVELRFTGSGSMAYQIAGRYFTPWPVKKDAPALSIDVAYDRTHLAQNDVVTATATVHSNLDKRANMVMVDLGIPPGFDLQSEDLQQMVEKTANKPTGRLEKFSLTATQAILYFNAIGAGETMTLKFRLRAKYPIRAASFASHVYEYYDPAVRGTAKPAQLEVTAK